jgi:hypothetical protein
LQYGGNSAKISNLYPKIFEISLINLLPLGWGRMKVEVDKRNLIPLPFIPSRQGRGNFWQIHLDNVRRKFSDFICKTKGKKDEREKEKIWRQSGPMDM